MSEPEEFNSKAETASVDDTQAAAGETENKPVAAVDVQTAPSAKEEEEEEEEDQDHSEQQEAVPTSAGVLGPSEAAEKQKEEETATTASATTTVADAVPVSSSSSSSSVESNAASDETNSFTAEQEALIRTQVTSRISKEVIARTKASEDAIESLVEQKIDAEVERRFAESSDRVDEEYKEALKTALVKVVRAETLQKREDKEFEDRVNAQLLELEPKILAEAEAIVDDRLRAAKEATTSSASASAASTSSSSPVSEGDETSADDAGKEKGSSSSKASTESIRDPNFVSPITVTITSLEEAYADVEKNTGGSSSQNKKTFMYKITVSENDSDVSWEVYREYENFAWLHQQLRRTVKPFTASLPRKVRVISTEHQMAMNDYLSLLVLDQPCVTSNEMRAFLNPETDVTTITVQRGGCLVM